MALDPTIAALIRDEVGSDPDFVTNNDDLAGAPAHTLDSLENIYTTTQRGNFDVLRTAYICWRLRRANYVKRGWDASTSGSLMSRRQRMKELDKIVKEYEILVDTTHRHAQSAVLSNYQANESGSSEFA